MTVYHIGIMLLWKSVSHAAVAMTSWATQPLLPREIGQYLLFLTSEILLKNPSVLGNETITRTRYIDINFVRIV